MSHSYITPLHTSENGYISLWCGDELNRLPDTIEVSGYTLQVKPEHKFHISLVCLKRLAPLVDGSNPERVEAQMTELFIQTQREVPMDKYELSGELYLVQKEERVTVVATCDVPGLEEYFVRLNNHYGANMPLQPTHLTLYTLQPAAGIGILSAEELGQLGRAVRIPELTPLINTTS